MSGHLDHGLHDAAIVMTGGTVPFCIQRTGHGFTELLTYEEWRDGIIQDAETAYTIGRDWLDSNPEEEYEWNEGQHPSYYETFFITNRAIFEAAIEHAREELGL